MKSLKKLNLVPLALGVVLVYESKQLKDMSYGSSMDMRSKQNLLMLLGVLLLLSGLLPLINMSMPKAMMVSSICITLALIINIQIVKDGGMASTFASNYAILLAIGVCVYAFFMNVPIVKSVTSSL